ncbi:MAG: DUF5719 family protein [Acidimicrobiales bacterium]
MSPPRRVELLVVIAAVVILGILGDSLIGSGGGALAAGGRDAGSLVVQDRGPTALAPVSAVSSSWYCEVATTALASSTSASSTSAGSKPAGSKAAAGAGPSGMSATGPGIALANTGPVAVTGTLSVFGEAGSAKTVEVSVPAHGQARIDETHLVTGPDIAATVVMDGGGIAVEQIVTVGKALIVTPCASSSSTSWYFAAGSTAGSNRLLIALYNPLPTSAVADLSFATNSGPESPSNDQNVVVPAMSQVVIDVGAHVQQKSLVATRVSVRDGRLVADQVQSEVVGGHTDVTVALGATAAGSLWDFPAGLDEKGTNEQLDIYNPSSSPASVQIGLDLSYGSAVPISMSVAGGSVVAVATADQHRIPIQSLFGVEVATADHQGIVVERSFIDSPPQPQLGLTFTVGGVPATSWVLAAGAPAGSVADRVVVENPGKAPVQVSVTAMSGGAAEPAPFASQSVSPGRSMSLSLSGPQLSLPLVVSAATPVVVEQDLVGPGGQGVSSILGEPAR